MPCPLCGDICRCASDAYSAASPRWLPDTDALADAAGSQTSSEAPEACVKDAPTDPEPPSRREECEAAPEQSSAWRLEVSRRLNRYQARRKPRPPRYPSLRLRFETEDPARTGSDISVEPSAFQHRATTASN